MLREVTNAPICKFAPRNSVRTFLELNAARAVTPGYAAVVSPLAAVGTPGYAAVVGQ